MVTGSEPVFRTVTEYSADSPGFTVCIDGLTESNIDASRAPSAETIGMAKAE